MKKILAILAFALLATAGRAQDEQQAGQEPNPPDWDRIEALVSIPASEYYYPFLMTRYTAGDSTLTEKDYYYLYYGYSCQPGYRPLLESPYVDSLRWSFSGKTAANAETYRRIVQACSNILAEEPFNLRDLNVLAFAYQMLDDIENAEKTAVKIAMISTIIKSTGSGLAEESPWHVIYPKHAEDILYLMEARFTRAMLVSTSVEFIPVSNMPNKRYKGYYFDISEAYKRRPDYLDDNKPKRKLEVNPRYNPKSRQYILPK